MCDLVSGFYVFLLKAINSKSNQKSLQNIICVNLIVEVPLKSVRIRTRNRKT